MENSDTYCTKSKKKQTWAIFNMKHWEEGGCSQPVTNNLEH